ncbi:MAG: hypothetical protein GY717_00745 [Rhodobacteraceae bacterium]|nr:hypothetical protein [Paracoccaceae bacterium]
MSLVRLVVFGAIGLTVVYLAVAWFVRSTRRERLEKQWDAANPAGDAEARRAEVEKGVDEYRGGLVYRSLLLIYIVPAVLVVANIVVTNWN